jgi:hypothetical protein
MRALVVYESMFGNTQTIANAIADGLSSHMSVETVEVGAAPDVVDGIDLVVVGGPTHQFGMSRASSREQAARDAPHELVSHGIGLREWLADVGGASESIAAVAFDTTLAKPRIIKVFGRAGRSATKRLHQLGFHVLRSPESFWVSGTTGPLAVGEVERARQWGEDVGATVIATTAREPIPV